MPDAVPADDAPAAKAVSEPKVKVSPPVTLATVAPWTTFDPLVPGSEPITHQGTPVPSNLVESVLAAAASAGVSLREV